MEVNVEKQLHHVIAIAIGIPPVDSIIRRKAPSDPSFCLQGRSERIHQTQINWHIRRNHMSQYKSHIAAVIDWHQFINDCAFEYEVPVETMYRIIMDVLVMRQRMESPQ